MKKAILKSALMAVVSVGLMAGGASALPILSITDGVNSVTIDDSTDPSGAGDGAVFFAGYLGQSEIVFSGASSFPAIGGVDKPELHLGAGVMSGSSLITFTMTDTFTSISPSIIGWLTDFGGSPQGGNVTFNATLNGVSIASYTGFGDPIQTSNYVPSASSYDFMLTGTIQGAGVSFDANVSPVPEPATMLLFGTGLAGLAGYRRKKSKKA